MSSQPALQPWTEPVLKAVAELRAESRHAASDPAAAPSEELDRLVSASAALEALLEDCNSSPDEWRHNVRNVLGAMQGYAELLLEEPDNHPPGLRACLERVLKALTSATAGVPQKAGPVRAQAGGLTGRILAVDDSADNRDLLTRYLRRAGHEVLSASSGEEALSILAEQPPDLVLLDLIMPGMGGGEVLTLIKANDIWRPIPVIVISGQQDRDGIISCIEAGADDYLFKPFNPVLLQARIKAGLERKRWHDREEQYLAQLERNQRFIRATFGRYVSDEVVQSLLEGPEGLKLGGDLRETTMLMSDIRRFSSICEKLPPEDVMKMLNNYLGTMSEVIIGHQGTIDEFIGDAILAIFGAPIAREDDADRAVQCALDMQEAMRDINRENRRGGLPEISMGIGVNTGAVIAGNIGSEKRSKYGVVGHHVNITARIESRTAGGEILVSSSTLDKLSTPRPVGPKEEVRVKGIDETVSIYRLLGAGGD